MRLARSARLRASGAERPCFPGETHVKRHLLLVDADAQSLRILEVSLRKAGYGFARISR